MPEAQRLPVVLCDLQGLTYEQAAEQPRWTVPTLRCRLAKARQRLKGRLTAAGPPSRRSPPPCSPRAHGRRPAALIRSTVLAATGGPVSAGAALLTHALLRGMLMNQIKFATTAALAALALASAGVDCRRRRATRKPQARHETEGRGRRPGQEPVAGKPVEMVEVRGRVVAPDGRP